MWTAIVSLVWLTPLAIWDLRRREIPHIALVAAPCLLAALAAIWRGNWPLALVAAVVVAVSERDRAPRRLRRPAFVAGLAASIGLALLNPDTIPGAFGIAGFWLAYEAGWHTGADALAQITLLLLWPDDLRLLAALGAARFLLAPLLHDRRRRPRRMRRLSPDELDAVGVPGLPSVLLGLVIFAVWRFATA